MSVNNVNMYFKSKLMTEVRVNMKQVSGMSKYFFFLFEYHTCQEIKIDYILFVDLTRNQICYTCAPYVQFK